MPARPPRRRKPRTRANDACRTGRLTRRGAVCHAGGRCRGLRGRAGASSAASPALNPISHGLPGTPRRHRCRAPAAARPAKAGSRATSRPWRGCRWRSSASRCAPATAQEAAAGDSAVPFSIQSVSKLFSLTLAMRLLGEALWERIDREPSGNPFNSLVQLESEQGMPRNPFINAGAIAVSDRLVSELGAGAKASLLEMLSEPGRRADRLRRGGRRLGGGHRLSQHRAGQLHEELRQASTTTSAPCSTSTSTSARCA